MAVSPRAPHGTVKSFTHANEPQWQPIVLSGQTRSADSDHLRTTGALEQQLNITMLEYDVTVAIKGAFLLHVKNKSREIPMNVRLKLK